VFSRATPDGRRIGPQRPPFGPDAVSIIEIRDCATSDGSPTGRLAALVDGRGTTATSLPREYAAIGRETVGILRVAIRSISKPRRHRPVPAAAKGFTSTVLCRGPF
jgi:hypothetical protein